MGALAVLPTFADGEKPTEPKIIYVDASFNEEANGSIDAPYKTITAAITAAEGGEKIIVKDGTYAEKVIINKKNLTLEAESMHGAIIDTDADYAVQFNGDDLNVITFSGFTVLGKRKNGGINQPMGQ